MFINEYFRFHLYLTHTESLQYVKQQTLLQLLQFYAIEKPMKFRKMVISYSMKTTKPNSQTQKVNKHSAIHFAILCKLKQFLKM